MNKRTIMLKVEPSLFTEIKVHIARTNQTLQSYIIGLIKSDMKNWK